MLPKRCSASLPGALACALLIASTAAQQAGGNTTASDAADAGQSSDNVWDPHEPAGDIMAQAARKITPIRNMFLPRGRGYDWSLAGYMDGKAYLPKKRPSFNLKSDFGARGDGRTDDTPALARAIAAASARREGGVIFLPAGTYVVTKPLTIKHSGVVLRGDSRLNTKLYFPRSLSEVTGISWVRDGSGRLKSPWSHGGAFITFLGIYPQKSDNEKTYLGRVTRDVWPGARRIPCRAANFRTGQRIRIFLNDRSTPPRSAGAAIASTPATPGVYRFGNTTLVLKDPPAWVTKLPAFQSAMAGLAAGVDDGPGLTPAQAAAADAALAEAGGEVGSAAGRGTVVAWVYGDNLANSGSPGEGNIIEHDSISYSARVVKVGRGFIMLDRDLPFPVLPSRRWVGSIHRDEPSVEGVGLERLTIEFKWTIVGPHFSDRGYNGVEFAHVSSSWVSDVAFVNADNALSLSWVHRSTVREVTVKTTKPRYKPGGDSVDNGHQGIVLNKGSSNMITGFYIRSRMIHDVAVTGASMSVLERGQGADMNLDHHRNGPFANLFTDIDVGKGSRPFYSGGAEGRGANTGRATTFWNVRSSRPAHALQLPPCGRDYGAMVNFLGSFYGGKCPGLRWFVRPLGPRAPRNLYRAQVDARRKLGRLA
ncbi:hypothetical protein ABPG75_000657 [Micractinium tetrahymenae]